MEKTENEVIIIGAGNVGTHLAHQLDKKNFTIRGICSRTIQSARQLAKYYVCESWTNAALIPPDAQYYFICVNDEAIAKVADAMPQTNGLVMHTSGSTPIEVLSRFPNHGVFYPIQTFTKNHETDFSLIPICIEASNKKNLNILKKLALQFSNNIIEANSAQRKHIHLSAVFACNFTNYMYVLAHDILNEQKLPFSILLPLILESFEKVTLMEPWQAQTGPAVRGDSSIIEEHIRMLSENPDYEVIYRIISEQITKRKNKEKTE